MFEAFPRALELPTWGAPNARAEPPSWEMPLVGSVVFPPWGGEDLCPPAGLIHHGTSWCPQGRENCLSSADLPSFFCRAFKINELKAEVADHLAALEKRVERE